MNAPIWPQIVSAIGSVISASMAAIAAWLSRSAIIEMRNSRQAEAEAREQARLTSAYVLVSRLADKDGASSGVNTQAIKTIQHDLRDLLATAVEWALPECRALSACPPGDVPKKSVGALEEIGEFILERLGNRCRKGKDLPDVLELLTNRKEDE